MSDISTLQKEQHQTNINYILLAIVYTFVCLQHYAGGVPHIIMTMQFVDGSRQLMIFFYCFYNTIKPPSA
jgi:hypothetical protein